MWGSKILCEARFIDAAQRRTGDKCSWVQNACKSKEKWNCLIRHYIRISNPSYSSTNSKKVSEEIFKKHTCCKDWVVSRGCMWVNPVALSFSLLRCTCFLSNSSWCTKGVRGVFSTPCCWQASAQGPMCLSLASSVTIEKTRRSPFKNARGFDFTIIKCWLTY